MSEGNHRIEIHPSALKQLETLYRSDRKLAAQFNKHIQALARNAYPPDVSVFEHTEQYDLCRTKVGRSWRLIYAVIGSYTLILILETVSREKAYKGQDFETLRTRIQAFLDTFSQ